MPAFNVYVNLYADVFPALPTDHESEAHCSFSLVTRSVPGSMVLGTPIENHPAS